MKAALLLALTLGTAQAATVYRGTVGAQPVALRLNGPDDSRYFYLNRGVDIPLDVQDSGGALKLTERLASWDQATDGSYTKITGRLNLSRSGAGLTGSWQSPDGAKTLPVALKPVNVAAEKLALPATPLLQKWRAEDAATFLKFNHALLPAGTANGLNWVREPLSGLRYPSLPAGAAGAGVLQDRLLDAARSKLDCQSDVGARADTFDWEQQTSVTYRSARLLSLRDTVSSFCGGAHPDAYTDGLILDLKTGRALTPSALWPKLTTRELHRRYLAAYPRRSDNAECVQAVQTEIQAQDTPNTDTAYASFLSVRGLTLWPNYLPHVVLACAEEVTLPYPSLAALAGPLAPRR